MKNSYSPWEELAALPHIELIWADLGARLGEYNHAQQVIRLNARLRHNQARSVLCHELRHAEHGDTVTTCELSTRRQERRADREAARLLINIEDLGDAIAVHGEHHGTLAGALRVSLHVVRTRLDQLDPTEHQELKDRLADLRTS